MADEGSANTFEYPVNGRTLTLRKVSLGQMEMLQRYVEVLDRQKRATKDVAEQTALSKKATEAVWTVVESRFIEPDDLEFVQLEIIAGRLDEKALLPILSNGLKHSAPPDDDTDPAPAKKPGRKAPAKKPAKKAAAPVANKSRAKR